MVEHVLYRGDNLPVMRSLASASIDTVYMDPPYNTGLSRAYNDTFTHEEWVDFMRPRLVEARRLLKSSGVILVSIGDHELPRLRLLLDEVFGEYSFLQMLIWQGKGHPGSSFSRGGLDYMVAYAKCKRKARVWKEVRPGTIEFLEYTRQAYEESGHDESVAGVKMREYARQHEKWMVNYEWCVQGVPSRPGPLTARSTKYHYTVTSPDGVAYTSDWRLPEARFEELNSEGKIVWGGKLPRRLVQLTEKPTSAPDAVFYSYGENPGKHVSDLMGYPAFDSPKDYRILMRWLGMATPEDGVVLDCFSGSGSTLEAVIRLNVEGSSRQAIGIEKGLADLTEQRVRSVITGVRPDGIRHSDSINAEFAVFSIPNESFFEDSGISADSSREDIIG